MSEIASNFTSDETIKSELEAMLKEKELEDRIKFLEEEKGLEVQLEADPNKMHLTYSIKSKDGISFKATANSKKMALTQCYTGFLGKLS